MLFDLSIRVLHDPQHLQHIRRLIQPATGFGHYALLIVPIQGKPVPELIRLFEQWKARTAVMLLPTQQHGRYGVFVVPPEPLLGGSAGSAVSLSEEFESEDAFSEFFSVLGCTEFWRMTVM